MTNERLADLRRKAGPWLEEVEQADLRELLDELDTASRALAALTRERDADKARLGWLETVANEPGGLLLHDGNELGRRGLGLRPGSMVRSLRQAIDGARGVPTSTAHPAPA